MAHSTLCAWVLPTTAPCGVPLTLKPNTPNPPHTTHSILKKRIIVAKDGVMWRTQAGRRHKRIKKSRGRLSELRGLAPLASSWARKLRKLGYKRRWWYAQKA